MSGHTANAQGNGGSWCTDTRPAVRIRRTGAPSGGRRIRDRAAVCQEKSVVVKAASFSSVPSVNHQWLFGSRYGLFTRTISLFPSAS